MTESALLSQQSVQNPDDQNLQANSLYCLVCNLLTGVSVKLSSVSRDHGTLLISMMQDGVDSG